MTPTILDTIVEATKKRVTQAKEAYPLARLQQDITALLEQETNKGLNAFTFPFERVLKTGDVSFICEVKKASPSKGIIAEDFPYLEIAKAYELAGASAISVLTEPDFFLGSLTYMAEIAQAVAIPVLRKDFIIDTYQIYEAKRYGASAILLICAILEEAKLREFLALGHALGLSCLVEAHDEAEIAKALACGARVIGVNNRNLKDFTVDITNSLRLRALVPDDIIFISESGLQTAEHIAQLRQANIQGALIGESFMRAPDKSKALAELAGHALQPKLKICGLRRMEDIELINHYQPDYAGFILAPSPRQLTPAEALALRTKLAPSIKAVGVFVNEKPEIMSRLAKELRLDVLQLHGDETEADIAYVKAHTACQVWKVVAVRSAADIEAYHQSSADLLLLDTYTAEKRGGSGKTFHWELLKNLKRPYILAGGLTPYNYRRALQASYGTPLYALDFNSGLEKDNYKDEPKLAQLFALRHLDC